MDIANIRHLRADQHASRHTWHGIEVPRLLATQTLSALNRDVRHYFFGEKERGKKISQSNRTSGVPISASTR